MDSDVSRQKQSSDSGSDQILMREAQLRRDMRAYAITVRELAYTVPNGIGERALLQLSMNMTTTADHLR